MTTSISTIDTTSADAVDAAEKIPVVARARDFARDELAPHALRTDVDGVSRDIVDRLRTLGLLNAHAPLEFGGAQLDKAGERAIHEHIAHGDFNTWLVWAQHSGLVAQYAERAKSGRPLGDAGERVLRGEILTGTAISDVRHYPRRYIRATPAPGGWLIDGTVSWVSGWGVNELLSVAAIDPATETRLLVLVDVADEKVRSEKLPLVVATGSRTWRVSFDAVFVPESDVVARGPISDWDTKDRNVISDIRAHAFGVARAIFDELKASDNPKAVAVQEAWQPRFADLRASAYGLSDRAEADPEGPQHFEDRLAIKIETLRSLSDIARALVISRAGSGILGTDTAQLHARSALFLQIQSQNSLSQAAQLDDIAALAEARNTL
ncbi:acyl-CoA dehydrogenase family protein [Rhodococcoides yunnanense]|uniref:acyl-CoA dehydrogenase family protein n=1 Tax=Rhodococcoides yunnanense TaxID=278209 RepID=UPI000934EA18|nr:acyl-CoA dehydrogenase family protein [Rhodococcus yunnanensis]